VILTLQNQVPTQHSYIYLLAYCNWFTTGMTLELPQVPLPDWYWYKALVAPTQTRLVRCLQTSVNTNVDTMCKPIYIPYQHWKQPVLCTPDISLNTFGGYHCKWYLRWCPRFWISSNVIFGILRVENYVAYQRCWYLTWISDSGLDIKVSN